MKNEINNGWIAYAQTRPQARVRLFCFPCAGGTALLYRDWVRALPATIDVCPVEYPGHGARMRELLHRHLPDLLEAAAEGLRPHIDRPFAFFGHSMGALVAFEVARRLRERDGHAPVHIFASAHRAPQLPHPDPTTHALPDDKLIEKLRKMEGTPAEVLAQPELMQLVLPLVRADFDALDHYAYGDAPPLSCPITAMGGMKDPTLRREQLAAWREQTTSEFSLQLFPGGHFYVQSAQPLLLGLIKRALVQ